MKCVYYFCLTLVMLSLQAQADQEESQTEQNENEFINLDLEKLLTLKIDPNLASLLDSHVRRAGERMLSFSYMAMRMSGNTDGSRDLTTDEVLDDFMVAPTSMSMDMSMISAMYAPTDRLTLMLMLPYKQLSMEHVTRMGQRFTTRSSGIGDLGVSGNFVLSNSDIHRFVVRAGIKLPTGSIDERGDTPAGVNQKLPYPMQLGSGSVGFVPGLEYHGSTERWSWGTGIKSVLWLAKNSNDYRLGNDLTISAWLAHSWTPAIANLFKVESHSVSNIHGNDPDLNPNMVPSADPERRAGHHIDLHIGMEFYRLNGNLSGLRLSVDVGIPLYDSLDGPQLDTEWGLTGTVQWTF